MYYVTFFGKYPDKIDQVINKLKQRQLTLTIESCIFHFLAIDIENQGKSEIIFFQCGLIDKILKDGVMED